MDGATAPADPTRHLSIERIESLHAIDGEWERLAAQSGNIFATPDFLRLWWHRYGNSRLELWSGRDAAGRLTALFPLYAWRRRPVRVLRFLGHGAGDQLGPLSAGCHPAAAGRALAEILARAKASVLIAEHLPGGGARVGDSDVVWRRRAASPVLPLGHGSWDAYLATRSSNFRQILRRQERKLTREHGLAFRLSDERTLEADLATLFRLHGLRWRRRTNFLARRSFHETFARAACRHGWLRLWLMELDGRPAAAWYGFRYGANESYYQSGRDPAWHQAPVGAVLVAHTIRCALRDGQREYRFLRGDEAYKYRFTDADAPLESLVLGRGLLGTLATRSAAALWHVRAWLPAAMR